jgi:hypothetical protein
MLSARMHYARLRVWRATCRSVLACGSGRLRRRPNTCALNTRSIGRPFYGGELEQSLSPYGLGFAHQKNALSAVCACWCRSGGPKTLRYCQPASFTSSVPRAFFAPNPAATRAATTDGGITPRGDPIAARSSHSSPSPGSFSGMEPYHQCVASVVPFATRQFRLSAGPIAVTSRLQEQLRADPSNHRLDE